MSQFTKCKLRHKRERSRAPRSRALRQGPPESGAFRPVSRCSLALAEGQDYHPKGRFSGRSKPLDPSRRWGAERKPDLLPPVWPMGLSELPGIMNKRKMPEKQTSLFFWHFPFAHCALTRTVCAALPRCPGAVAHAIQPAAASCCFDKLHRNRSWRGLGVFSEKRAGRPRIA